MAALLVFTALSIPGAAGAAEFDQFIVFGDSTLDTGYFRYKKSGNTNFDTDMPTAISKGATGGYAGNGVMNTIILADKLGLSAVPIDAPSGGTNYANGGATTVAYDSWCFPNNICTIQQIRNYLHSVGGVANPDALYLIKTGDNDATYVTNQGPTWIKNHPQFLSTIASELALEVARLQAAGARTIMVRNSYDAALFAGWGGDISKGNKAAYARSYSLGMSEWSDLQANGVLFIPADNDSLFSYVAHNPFLFGFTRHNVLASSAPSPITAALSILSPDQQRNYLFIDGVHLTTAGQTIEADYEYSLLTAPSEVSLMAENAVQGGWTRAATIQGQIDASAQQCRPCGRNFWTTAEVYNTKVRNAPGFTDDSGTPFGGAVGLDYRLPSGVIVGAAFTASSQSQGFSTGGHFNQVDEAPSFYVASMNGPLWGNAVLTYDLFQDNVARRVPLGIFTDQNYADTAGHSLALALRGGGNASLGQITTGPVAGLVMQQVYVDDFTETGNSGVTALSFGSQTRNSLVTQLGWRVLVDRGNLQPFAEANWNHEWADRNRTVSASLTSVAPTSSYTPSYFLDAAPVASDWATLSLGAFYKLSPRAILRGAASAMLANPQMENYGGELGLNVSF